MMAEHTVRPVPTYLVPAIWPSVAAIVQRGVGASRGDRFADDYYAVCAGGSATLWLIGRDNAVVAICISEVVQYPQRRIALLDLLAGEGIFGWLSHLDAAVEQWARERGCSAIQAGGRPGFVPVTKPLGYRAIGVVVERSVHHV